MAQTSGVAFHAELRLLLDETLEKRARVEELQKTAIEDGASDSKQQQIALLLSKIEATIRNLERDIRNVRRHILRTNAPHLVLEIVRINREIETCLAMRGMSRSRAIRSHRPRRNVRRTPACRRGPPREPNAESLCLIPRRRT
jgi:hypothetical protein